MALAIQVSKYPFAADAKPKEISAGAFENCDSLETVTLPNSIITIGERAFYGCDTLQSVTLPTAIKIIPKELFSQCKNLKSIDIPEGVTEIQETAFGICIYNHRTTKTNQKYPSVNL